MNFKSFFSPNFVFLNRQNFLKIPVILYFSDHKSIHLVKSCLFREILKRNSLEFFIKLRFTKNVWKTPTCAKICFDCTLVATLTVNISETGDARREIFQLLLEVQMAQV